MAGFPPANQNGIHSPATPVFAVPGTPMNAPDPQARSGPFFSTPTLANSQSPSGMSGSRQHLPTPAMTQVSLPHSGLTASQAVLRLLQMNDRLCPAELTNRSYWNDFADEFFIPKSTLKIVLQNDQSSENMTFVIPQPLIARFFQTQYLCDLASIQPFLGTTNEYMFSYGMFLECPGACYSYHYHNDFLVLLKGVLSAIFVPDSDGVLKIQHMIFECHNHQEFISKDKVASTSSKPKSKSGRRQSVPMTLPQSPVNAWGVPDRVLNFMRMADVFDRLTDVVTYSVTANVPPRDALLILSQKARAELDKRNGILTPRLGVQASMGQSPNLVPTMTSLFNNQSQNTHPIEIPTYDMLYSPTAAFRPEGTMQPHSPHAMMSPYPGHSPMLSTAVHSNPRAPYATLESQQGNAYSNMYPNTIHSMSNHSSYIPSALGLSPTIKEERNDDTQNKKRKHK